VLGALSLTRHATAFEVTTIREEAAPLRRAA
jgi:hypothetical protein